MKCLDDWKEGKVLGSGAFGSVRKFYNKVTAVERAVKVIQIGEGVRSKVLISTQREVELLSHFTHDRIVKFCGAFVEDQRILIFMEMMPGV